MEEVGVELNDGNDFNRYSWGQRKGILDGGNHMSKGANGDHHSSSAAGLGEEFGKRIGVRTWQEPVLWMLERLYSQKQWGASEGYDAGQVTQSELGGRALHGTEFKNN